MRTRTRPDAVLFREMSLTQLDGLAQRLCQRADSLRRNGEDAASLELRQVAADLDAAWWAKFQQAT